MMTPTWPHYLAQNVGHHSSGSSDMERVEREGRRDSFLGDAEDYLAARPAYPNALLDAAVKLGELSEGAPLLEFGCGTGEATGWFAKRGFRILALDRSSEMTRLAEQRLAGLNNAEVRCADFESAPLHGRFEGLLSATSYHWLDPKTRVGRCADAIVPGGTIILLWHTHPRPFTGYFQHSQPIYRELIPDWKPPATPGMAEEGIVRIIEELSVGGLFDRFERRAHSWTRVYDRALYMRLLNTYSDHRLLQESQRKHLQERLADLIDQEFAGVVERPYRTELVVGRRTANDV